MFVRAVLPASSTSFFDNQVFFEGEIIIFVICLILEKWFQIISNDVFWCAESEFAVEIQFQPNFDMKTDIVWIATEGVAYTLMPRGGE